MSLIGGIVNSFMNIEDKDDETFSGQIGRMFGDGVKNLGKSFIKEAVGMQVDDDDSTFSGQIGRSIAKGLFGVVENEDEPVWVDWIESFESNSQANYAIFSVEPEESETCILSAGVFDENDNLIKQESWRVDYDEEIQELELDRMVYIYHKNSDDERIIYIDNTEENTPENQLVETEESVENRLQKLKKLYDSGLIEEDEYKEKRKELIALL